MKMKIPANNALTIFSPSPTHLLVNDDADILKKFISAISAASAFTSKVFPFPGGPYKSSPFSEAATLTLARN